MTTHHHGLPPLSGLEAAPLKPGSIASSSHQLYYHTAPTTASSTTTDPAAESFYPGLTLGEEFRYMSSGIHYNRGPSSVPPGSHGTLKATHPYPSDNLTTQSALASSQSLSSTPVSRRPRGRRSVRRCRLCGLVPGLHGQPGGRGPAGAGLPLPQPGTTSTSLTQSDPQLQRISSSSRVPSAAHAGKGSVSHTRQHATASSSYYGLPSNETTPPSLAPQRRQHSPTKSHASDARAADSEVRAIQASWKALASPAKESFSYEICDGQIVRQRVVVSAAADQAQTADARGAEHKTEEERSCRRLAGTEAPAAGVALTGPQQAKEAAARSQFPSSAPLPSYYAAEDLAHSELTRASGLPVSHTYTYTVRQPSESEEPQGGDYSANRVKPSAAPAGPDASYSLYPLTLSEASQVYSLQAVPGYYAPGFDYPLGPGAPVMAPGTYSYDVGAAYPQSASAAGDAYSAAAYAAYYGGSAYAQPPSRFAGTYFVDAEGNTYWSAGASSAGEPVYVPAPPADGGALGAAIPTPGRTRLPRHIGVSAGGDGELHREGLVSVPSGGYDSAPAGFLPAALAHGSFPTHQPSAQPLLPSVSSFYYPGSPAVPMPEGDEEDAMDRHDSGERAVNWRVLVGSACLFFLRSV
ncbi:hypothetical protein BESB_013560 [Besnoitia besnoiti]|uniref:Proteophosphoglycan 5, related protein n=1 Tax=Besnoitia besnoiti TaxID=94643 RepID=A0A2A9M6D4_BESBE|nr:hypothetical protein BESB_013560 [Besnoitia besnoiti]PFH32744.1 hypothetical protein BESB_013560 [Besnoitia besnoiti]